MFSTGESMKLRQTLLILSGLIMITLNISLRAQTGWTVLNPGTAANLNALQVLDRHTIFVAGDAGTVLWSNDSGLTWQDISPDSPLVPLNDINFFNYSTGLVVGEGGTIFHTTDGGNNWSIIPSGVSDNLLTVAFWDSIGICGGLSQTILYSSDQGNSWNIAQTGFFGGFWGSWILAPDISFVIGENSIFQPLFGKSINQGQSWDFTPFYLNNNEGRAYSLQFTDLLNGYAACGVWDGRGAVAKTIDGGISWNSTFFNAPLYEVHFPISNASLVGFAVGEGGQILKTYNAGANWQSQTSGTSQTLNDVAFFDLATGYIVGNNGTVLKTETGGEPPVHLSDHTSIILNEFQLLRNYPNPFNSSTSISWQLAPLAGQSGNAVLTGAAGPARQNNTAGQAVGSLVELKIFNSVGQKVRTLVQQKMGTGYHSVIWDGRDDTGNPVPSGIYYCVIETEFRSEIAKLLLVK